jgi:hypothetical protein
MSPSWLARVFTFEKPRTDKHGLHCKHVKPCFLGFFSKLFSVASVLQRSNTEDTESLSDLSVKVLKHRDRGEHWFGCGRKAAPGHLLHTFLA